MAGWNLISMAPRDTGRPLLLLAFLAMTTSAMAANTGPYPNHHWTFYADDQKILMNFEPKGEGDGSMLHFECWRRGVFKVAFAYDLSTKKVGLDDKAKIAFHVDDSGVIKSSLTMSSSLRGMYDEEGGGEQYAREIQFMLMTDDPLLTLLSYPDVEIRVETEGQFRYRFHTKGARAVINKFKAACNRKSVR